MEPLFNKDLKLVGWLAPDEYIFDKDMKWVAYIANHNIWSSETDHWLGPIHGATCYDQLGKPIAWGPKEFLSGIAKPMRPIKPIEKPAPKRNFRPAEPSRPGKPLRPMGGWSRLSFDEWLKQ